MRNFHNLSDSVIDFRTVQILDSIVIIRAVTKSAQPMFLCTVRSHPQLHGHEDFCIPGSKLNRITCVDFQPADQISSGKRREHVLLIP